MPTHCWHTTNDNGEKVWRCRWGHHGKIYESKDKETAKRKADKQGQAAYAHGYKG